MNTIFILYLLITIMGLFIFSLSPMDTVNKKTNMQIFVYLIMIICWPLVTLIVFFIWCYLICISKRSL